VQMELGFRQAADEGELRFWVTHAAGCRPMD
jgi:hypothetical protein